MIPSLVWNRQQDRGDQGRSLMRSNVLHSIAISDHFFLFDTPNSFGCSKKKKEEGEKGHTLQRTPGMNKVG